MDTIVLDIETKNTFGDVGGQSRLLDLEMSVVGTYSYKKDTYFCFEESNFVDLKKLLQTPAILVGFSCNKFDFPILNKSLGLNLMQYPRIDLSDEIEMRTGRWVGLDALAQTNLDMKKPHSGIMAPILYAEGRIDELKAYCLNDVAMTKKLFDLIKKQGFLIIPSKHDESIKLKIDLMENPSLF